MWKKPWGYKEGFICGAGLFVTGLLLQWSVGGIRWGLFAWPVNIIVLVLFLLLLAGMHGLRKRVYCFGWLSHYTAAVSSLVCVAAITVIMGLVRQVPPPILRQMSSAFRKCFLLGRLCYFMSGWLLS